MRTVRLDIRLLLLFVACAAGCSAGDGPDDSAADKGQRIYRDGTLPSGEPLTAIVAGDVPVSGTQFSCASCHGRSGMGTAEGAYIVPPIAGPFLFAESPQPRRPAYTIESLATVLREGTTPAGRTLEAKLMPRYRIDDTDAASLAAYLKILSDGNSPGVDDASIHLATVITEGVDPEERESILAVLNQFAAELNRQTRNEGERWDRGYTPESRLPTVFREWVVDEWSLTGPRESWTSQLEKYYEQQPVFAMLSGRSAGAWDEVARFCERREIPCLFPSTDQAIAMQGDFYTFYYFRGLVLEAELIASHLASEPTSRVVQVYCDSIRVPVAMALRDSLASSGTPVDDFVVDCGGASPALLPDARAADDAAVVLWLDRSQYPASLPPGRLYLSSTMLGEGLPDAVRDAAQAVFLVHPYRLPGSIDPAFRRFTLWAKTRSIAVSRPRIQAEVFFACLALNDALKHMGRFFIRDYMLDMMDHAQGMAAYVPIHPRPTFGPGQRFLSKGGYVLPVVDGELVTDDAEWIVP